MHIHTIQTHWSNNSIHTDTYKYIQIHTDTHIYWWYIQIHTIHTIHTWYIHDTGDTCIYSTIHTSDCTRMSEYIHTYIYIQIHTYTSGYIQIWTPLKIQTQYAQNIHIHTDTYTIKQPKIRYALHETPGRVVCICMYFVCICVLSSAYMYVSGAYLYVSVCIVCIGATSNLPCKKYIQIQAIHTNMHTIHTRYIQKYSTDTGKILQFISVCIVCICMYLYVSCMYHVCIITLNMHSMKWIQADTGMIWKLMYLYVSDTGGYALHVFGMYQIQQVYMQCIYVCIMILSVPEWQLHIYACIHPRFGGHEHIVAWLLLWINSKAVQALKQVRQTHGFETMLEIALYCFRVVSRVVSRPYHGPRVDVVQRAARLGSPRRLHSPLGKQASLLLDMLREMVPQSPAGNSSPITTIIYSLIHTNTVWYSHI